MGRRTDWRIAADAYLSDLNWHPREDVIKAAMKTIPPGIAFRKGEATRESERRRMGVQKCSDVDERESIVSGARRMALDVIRTAVSEGRYEQRKEDGVYYLRLHKEMLRVTEVLIRADAGNIAYFLACEDGYVRAFRDCEVYVKAEEN